MRVKNALRVVQARVETGCKDVLHVRAMCGMHEREALWQLKTSMK